MRFNIKGLVIWFLIYYFVIDGALREILLERPVETFNLTDSIFSISSIFFLFLFSFSAFFAFFKYYRFKKYFKLVTGIFLAIFLPIILRYLFEQIFTDVLFGAANYNRQMAFKDYVIDNVFFALRFMPVGVLFYFVEYGIFKQQREQELIIENQRLEMSMLRSQINPHFLLNSLNNIYSLVYHKSPHSLEALDRLTELLKSSLYEKKEKVLLRDEMKLVDNYIVLQKLRYDFDIHVLIEIDHKLDDQLIPSFTILPLVENAFKHGQIKEAAHPFMLAVSSFDSKLIIKAKNRKSQKLKDAHGGVGLDNLKRRLALMYANADVFELKDNAEVFEVCIKLPLK